MKNKKFVSIFYLLCRLLLESIKSFILHYVCIIFLTFFFSFFFFTGNKYKTRWKNLRDAFIRQARKRSQLDSSSSKISKEYLYSRQLSFLKNDKTISDIKLLIDNVPNVSIKKPKLEIDTDNISTKSYEIQPSLSFTSSSIRKNPSSSNKKKSSSSIHKTNYHNELDEPIIDNFLNVSLPSYSTEIDEDKSFFHSLMPMVKLFNIDQKLEFRCEVLNLIKKIRASTVIKTNVSNNKPSTSKQDSIQSHYKISLNNDQSLSTSFKNDPLQNSFQNINEDSDEFSI